MNNDNLKAVLLCTEHKGVFFGLVKPETDLTQRTLTNIKNGRMAINWRNGKGVMGLAEAWPDDKCKIGAAADIEVLHDITAVFTVTDEAKEKWISE